jgi:hypothetical protein
MRERTSFQTTFVICNLPNASEIVLSDPWTCTVRERNCTPEESVMNLCYGLFKFITMKVNCSTNEWVRCSCVQLYIMPQINFFLSETICRCSDFSQCLIIIQLHLFFPCYIFYKSAYIVFLMYTTIICQ